MKKKQELFEESDLLVRLSIKRGGLEIVAEGTISKINKELDALANFVENVAEKIETMETPVETPVEIEEQVDETEISTIPTSDIPSITSSKRTIDNLEALFDTSWGKTPRSLAEIAKALEVNAIPDRIAAINVYLRRLVKRGKLRRLKKEGKYHYFRLPE